jgi:hypothetical protein
LDIEANRGWRTLNKIESIFSKALKLVVFLKNQETIKVN